MDTGLLIAGLLVGIVGVVIAGYWRGTARSRSDTGSERDSGAIEALKERYVDGDIDSVEYEKRLETLYEDDANGGGAATTPADSSRDGTSSQPTTVEGADRQTSDDRSPRRNRNTCGPGRKSRRRSKKRGCR